MRNIELMTKVKELATKLSVTRESITRVSVQIAIIRQAFGVKNDEHNKTFRDYERELVLSDDEIRKEFEQYLGFYEWAIRTNDEYKQRDFKNQIYYFIDAVRFFHKDLADEFEKSAL